MTKSNTTKNPSRTCSPRCYCGDQPKSFIAINGTCVICGKDSSDAPRPYMEQVGYESALRSLIRGDYLSPKQVWYDNGYEKEMWANFDLFERGVLDAVEKHRVGKDLVKLKSKIEKALNKYG